MIRSLSLAEINKTLAGQWLIQPRDDQQVVTQISTDSRAIKNGACYIPLVGERFDGHQFIASAIKSGASLVLTEQADIIDDQAISQGHTTVLLVDDTLLALAKIAGLHRRLFTGPVVSVTGSAGKTSVKQLMASVLSVCYDTWMTQGNLNNHIGAPLTLLALEDHHQAAVIELGASAAGEIAYTAQFTQPHVGIITNAGDAHLEGFGSVEGIVQTKGELLDYIQPGGTAILNADDKFYGVWQKRAAHLNQLSFGLNASADVRATNIVSDLAGSRFDLQYAGQIYSAHINLVGEHNVINAVAVAAAAIALELSIDDILQGLNNCQPVNGRMQLLNGINHCQIFNDAYNANPASFKAAINSIKSADSSLLVMGDMAEMGDQAIDAHRDIGHFAKQQGITQLLACGELSRHAVTAFGDNAVWFADQESLIQYLKNHLQPQSVVLVKGSRSAGMDIVAHALTVGQED